MSKKKQILWFDNDTELVRELSDVLEEEGYEVQLVGTLTEADAALEKMNDGFSLLILDVMVPTTNEQEEKIYPPKDTDKGHKTGLVFYERHSRFLKHMGTPVLVFTVRTDQGVLEDFLKAGLHRDSFSTKFGLRDDLDFVKKVKSLAR